MPELELAEKQFKDLCVHRTNLYKEAERVETIRKQEILDRISYFSSARVEIAAKKTQVEEEIKSAIKDLKHKKDHHSKAALYELPPSALSLVQKKRGKRRSIDDTSHSSYSSSSNSKHSSHGESNFPISKQLATFLNILTRKKTYNTAIIREVGSCIPLSSSVHISSIPLLSFSFSFHLSSLNAFLFLLKRATLSRH